VIAIDIVYSTYATNQQYYKMAFTAGVAAALNVAQDAVYGASRPPPAWLLAH